MEVGEEETNDRSPSSSSPLSPSLRNHLLSVPTFSKKPVGPLPGLSNCHSCGLHCPSKLQSGNLQTLDSQWRIVLLCKICLGLIRSAEVCSYCFSKISKDDGALLDCRACSRRIHFSCVPMDRSFVALSELHPDSFICIDCCALPRFCGRSPSVGSRVSLEDLVRNSSSVAEKKATDAARAKEKAMKKIVLARHVAEWARNSVDAVVTVKDPTPSGNLVLTDEELALQLHLAMNGSQRKSRNPRPTNLDHSAGSKKLLGSGNTIDTNDESGSNDICRTIEVCTEDKAFFKSIEKTWSDHSPSIQLDEKNQNEDTEVCTRTDLREIPVKEEHESYSNKLVNSGGDDSTAASISMSCQRPNALNGNVLLSECGRGSPIESDKINRKDINGCSGSSSVETSVKEEKESCSNRVVNSSEGDTSIVSISMSCQRPNASNATVVLSECGRGTGEDSTEKQWKKRCSSIESDIHGCSGRSLVEVPVKEKWESSSRRGAGKDPSGKQRKKRCSSVELDKKNQEDINGCNGSTLVEVPVKEECGCFSIRVVNSVRVDNSIDAISTSCQRPNESNLTVVAVALSECG